VFALKKLGKIVPRIEVEICRLTTRPQTSPRPVRFARLLLANEPQLVRIPLVLVAKRSGPTRSNTSAIIEHIIIDTVSDNTPPIVVVGLFVDTKRWRRRQWIAAVVSGAGTLYDAAALLRWCRSAVLVFLPHFGSVIDGAIAAIESFTLI
jgi:hypothetical protein